MRKTKYNTSLNKVIKKFATIGLGCSCPDEVFQSIYLNKFPRTDLPIDWSINIGNRLLIYLSLNQPISAVEVSLPEIIHMGKKIRDDKHYNRIRFVFIKNCLEENYSTIANSFALINANDDKCHLHILDIKNVPDELVRELVA